MSEVACGCRSEDEGARTVMCAEHWDWLVAWLDEPPKDLPGLRELVRQSRFQHPRTHETPPADPKV